MTRSLISQADGARLLGRASNRIKLTVWQWLDFHASVDISRKAHGDLVRRMERTFEELVSQLVEDENA